MFWFKRLQKEFSMTTIFPNLHLSFQADDNGWTSHNFRRKHLFVPPPHTICVRLTPDTLFPNYCFNQNLLSGSTQLGLDNVCHLMFTNECLLPNTLEPNKIIFLLLNGQGHTKTFIWIVIQVYFHEITQKQAFRSLDPRNWVLPAILPLARLAQLAGLPRNLIWSRIISS